MLAVKKLKQKQSRGWVRSFSTTKLSIPFLQEPGSSETLPHSLGPIVSLALLPFCVAMFSTTDLWEGILWMKLKIVARVAMSPSNC